MVTSYRALFDAVKQAALGRPASLDRGVRERILQGLPVEGLLGEYVDTVRRRATDVTDGQVAQLKAAGVSEEVIFEATVCAAVSAGAVRERAALQALQDAYAPV